MSTQHRKTAESMRLALGLSPQRLGALRRAIPRLHAWYEGIARDLPWRRTRDPYAIWISEVMLQQTQVATVIPYFHSWMRDFPTVERLARARRPAVLRRWEGLGYYSRALNLHRAAREICDRHEGKLPRTLEQFRALPGVGPYTAAAVLSIAFDQDLAVVDGNVRRVFSRLVSLRTDCRRAPWSRALEELADHLLLPGAASTHNQAVMELGEVLCTPRSPACGECCLSGVCGAHAAGDPESCPPRRVKPAIPHHQIAVALVLRQGQLLVSRRPYGGLLGGLWELPEVRIQRPHQAEEALLQLLRRDYHLEVEVTGSLPPVVHAYSHFRVTLHPRICAHRTGNLVVAEGTPRRWLTPARLPEVAMPRADRKVLELLASQAGVDDPDSFS